MIDTVGAKIIDGFILRIDNQGLREIQELKKYLEKYAVRDILEVIGPGGIKLSEPIDVNDQVGYQNYEIRFTETGSEYYLTGGIPGFLPWWADDPKAADRVPFEIWDVGMTESDSDDFRLAVKTLDDISIFSNPFFGFGTMSGYLKQDFMRFTNVPTQVKIRIFSLAVILETQR